MKLSFMNFALARITTTTAQTPQSIHMPVLAMSSGARNLHVGVVLFNLCKGLFFVLCQSPMRMHNRSSGHPMEHRIFFCNRDVTDFEK